MQKQAPKIWTCFVDDASYLIRKKSSVSVGILVRDRLVGLMRCARALNMNLAPAGHASHRGKHALPCIARTRELSFQRDCRQKYALRSTGHFASHSLLWCFGLIRNQAAQHWDEAKLAPALETVMCILNQRCESDHVKKMVLRSCSNAQLALTLQKMTLRNAIMQWCDAWLATRKTSAMLKDLLSSSQENAAKMGAVIGYLVQRILEAHPVTDLFDPQPKRVDEIMGSFMASLSLHESTESMMRRMQAAETTVTDLRKQMQERTDEITLLTVRRGFFFNAVLLLVEQDPQCRLFGDGAVAVVCRGRQSQGSDAATCRGKTGVGSAAESTHCSRASWNTSDGKGAFLCCSRL
jgi:hypothetical protein